ILFFLDPKKMSKDTKIKDQNWLEKSVAEEHIKLFEYSYFKNIQPIGNGAYGNVVRVSWKNADRFLALKSFNNDEQTLEVLVKEVDYSKVSIKNKNNNSNILIYCGTVKIASKC